MSDSDAPRPPDDPLLDTLRQTSTASLTTVLLERGVRSAFVRGPRPLQASPKRIAGRAFTLRFVPAREDLANAAAWASPKSTRSAIEAMPSGVIAVVDARGITSAGIFGDILCGRMVQRRIAGLVTDGALRDRAGIERCGLPVWCTAIAAPPSVAALTFVDWQEPIGCGDVAVFPDDYIVADADGSVVIPASMAVEVAAQALEQEHFEGWVVEQVDHGARLPGLYPPNEATRARYESERHRGRGSR